MTKTHTSEMVERVARAMLDDTPAWTDDTWDNDLDGARSATVREFLEKTYIGSQTEEIALCAARAAIKEMREPTDVMCNAGKSTEWPMSLENGTVFLVPGFDAKPSSVWRRMLDSAL